MRASATALTWSCDGHLQRATACRRQNAARGSRRGRRAGRRARFVERRGVARTIVPATTPPLRALGNRSLSNVRSFTEAPEIAVGAIGHWRNLTTMNAGLRLAARVQSIWWKSDGFDVQGWLLLPEHSNGKMPMVTIVHGGPAAAVMPHFSGPGLTQCAARARLRGVPAESPRQLRPGRALHPGQCPRFRSWRFARHSGRHRRRGQGCAHRHGAGSVSRAAATAAS